MNLVPTFILWSILLVPGSATDRPCTARPDTGFAQWRDASWSASGLLLAGTTHASCPCSPRFADIETSEDDEDASDLGGVTLHFGFGRLCTVYSMGTAGSQLSSSHRREQASASTPPCRFAVESDTPDNPALCRGRPDHFSVDGKLSTGMPRCPRAGGAATRTSHKPRPQTAGRRPSSRRRRRGTS